MDNKYILQSLTESFEVLKDSWDRKKDAITHCIVETEVYDGDISMSMWQYVLQKNKQKLSEKEGAEELVYNVLKKYSDKHFNYYRNNFYDIFIHGECLRTMLEHVAPYVIKNIDVIRLIYGISYNAGYDSIFYEVPSSCIAAILLQDKPSVVDTLMKSLASNKLLVDVSIGSILRGAFKFIENVKSSSDLSEVYSITNEVKDVLLSNLNYIHNAEERADCMITVLSL